MCNLKFVKNALVLFSLILFINSKSYSNENIKSFHFSIGYKYFSTEMKHNETSSTSIINKLGVTTNNITHNIEFGLSKEFFVESSFSISLLINGGWGQGKTENPIANISYNYNEKNFVKFFGSGLNFNINIRLKKLKLRMQPFVGVNFLREISKFIIDYSTKGQTGTFQNTTTIDNEIKTSAIVYSIGLKFLDYNKNLMSYFKLGYSDYFSDTNNINGNIGSTKLIINNFQKDKANNFNFSTGLGFLF